MDMFKLCCLDRPMLAELLLPHRNKKKQNKYHLLVAIEFFSGNDFNWQSTAHNADFSSLFPFRYQNLETFIIDVNLVFDNCEKFNEDNSDIGRAGHNMRKFFEKRWTELLKQTN